MFHQKTRAYDANGSIYNHSFAFLFKNSSTAYYFQLLADFTIWNRLF